MTEPTFADREVTGAEVRAATGPVVLARCTLTGDLRELDLADAVLTDCVLDEAKLRDTRLDGARISGGSAVRANLNGADLTDAVFTGVDLSHARFTDALLAETRFTGCKMIGADLTALRGLAVTFRLQDCNLQLGNLTDAHLRGLRLHGTDLTEAQLAGADLRDAVFENCRLRDVELSGTRLSGADLRTADLGELTEDSPRQLRGAVISADQAAAICTALGLTVL